MSQAAPVPGPVTGLPPYEDWAGDLLGVDHTVVRVPNLDQGVAWYRRLLGLVEAARSPGKVYLASPLTGTIVLGLAEGDPGLEYASFRARDSQALERLAGKLKGAGVDFERGIAGSRPGAIDALRLVLPTGHTMELLHAETTGKNKPGPGYPGEGYVTGAIDVRTSHLQLRTTDVVELSEFVQKIGFRVSNYVPTPDGTNHMIQFTRVNDSTTSSRSCPAARACTTWPWNSTRPTSTSSSIIWPPCKFRRNMAPAAMSKGGCCSSTSAILSEPGSRSAAPWSTSATITRRTRSNTSIGST